MTLFKPAKLLLRGCAALAMCLFAAATVWAEPDALFTEATRRLGHEPPAYAYTLRTTGSDEVVLETFDPSLDTHAQWQLLSINEAAPDAQRLEQYREQKRKELGEKPRKKFAEVVDVSSLRRVAENDQEVLYEFKPKLFDDKLELNQKFVGKIIITKADQRIRQMEFRNTENIEPAPVLSLEKLYTLVKFMTLADGQPVARSIEIHTQGTAFEAKKFDEKVTQEYSDYRRTTPEAPDVGFEAAPGTSAVEEVGLEVIVEEEP